MNQPSDMPSQLATESTAAELMAAEPAAHGFHDFGRKLLQPHIFENLLHYVRWQVALRRGEDVPPPEFGPVSINLDITTACNHYCHHCVDLHVLNSGRRLSCEWLEELLDDLVPRGLKSVILIGGGEPTLHPQFTAIVQRLKERDLRIGIVSNGVRMSVLAEVAPWLGAQDWLRLSLDAATEETFAAIHNSRSATTLLEILEATRELRRQYAEFALGYSFIALSADHRGNGMALTDNIDEIPAAAELARDYGFDYLSVKPCIDPAARTTDAPDDYLERLREQIAAARVRVEDDFEVVESFNLVAMLEGRQEQLKQQPVTCHVNFFRVVATPAGIHTCPLWRGYDMALLDAGTSDSLAGFLRDFAAVRGANQQQFDPSQRCAHVTCIYNPVNWFVEQLIRDPEALQRLEVGVDHQDFFL